MSRETMQDSELLRKLGQVLTKDSLNSSTNKPRKPKLLISILAGIWIIDQRRCRHRLYFKDDLLKIASVPIDRLWRRQTHRAWRLHWPNGNDQKDYSLSLVKTVSQWIRPLPWGSAGTRFWSPPLNWTVDEYVMQSLGNLKKRKSFPQIRMS